MKNTVFLQLNYKMSMQQSNYIIEVKGVSKFFGDKMVLDNINLYVKKGEFEIGRIIPKDSDLWQNPEKARAYMLATYQQLLPLYQLAVAQ